jgi:hypothetical protein
MKKGRKNKRGGREVAIVAVLGEGELRDGANYNKKSGLL